VGVVSPFRAQANLVRDLVEGRPSLIGALAPAGFIADTVHRFQGDERDLMLFSPVVSEGVHRGALAFLRSNPNLFNVAITRARGGLVVVGDRNAARNSGVDYLSRFADHISVLGKESGNDSREGREDFGPQYPSVARPQEVSSWEETLYEALYAAGLRPDPQVAVENYRLDLAIYAGQHKLDIEVDGERYHRTWTGEHTRRDQLRSQRLIELGWDVMRFWVYEIRDEIDSCVRRVDDWVQARKTGDRRV